MRGTRAKALRRAGKRKLPRRAGPRRLSREDALKLGVRRPIKGKRFDYEPIIIDDPVSDETAV